MAKPRGRWQNSNLQCEWIWALIPINPIHMSSVINTHFNNFPKLSTVATMASSSWPEQPSKHACVIIISAFGGIEWNWHRMGWDGCRCFFIGQIRLRIYTINKWNTVVIYLHPHNMQYGVRDEGFGVELESYWSLEKSVAKGKIYECWLASSRPRSTLGMGLFLLLLLCRL